MWGRLTIRHWGNCMADRNTQVVGVGPDMTLQAFTAVLKGKSTLTDKDITDSYNAIVARKVSPLFCLGVFFVESKFGALGICNQYRTLSPGNTRTSLNGKGRSVQTAQGVYQAYGTWTDGFDDLALRLISPDYVYAQRGLKTIEQILPVYAPSGDGNSPAAYVNSVVTMMNGWISSSTSGGGNMKDPTNRIDIVHANKGRDGGTPQLLVMHSQEGTNYLPDFFRSSGDDSTIWCKQDGTLIRMQQDTDSAWTNGMMIEPIDHNNPVVQSLYKQGVRNTNNYSLTIEHQGFASGKFTDAAIEASAQMCAYWMQKYGWTDVDNRIVGHFQVGEHKNCPGPNFPWAKLRARVKELLGGAVVPVQDLPYGVTQDSAGALIFPGNIPLNFGFKDAFLTLFGNVIIGDLGAAIVRGVRIFGLPTGPETADDTGSTQDFEMSTFRFDKNEAPGWQIRLYKKTQAA